MAGLDAHNRAYKRFSSSGTQNRRITGWEFRGTQNLILLQPERLAITGWELSIMSPKLPYAQSFRPLRPGSRTSCFRSISSQVTGCPATAAVRPRIVRGAAHTWFDRRIVEVLFGYRFVETGDIVNRAFFVDVRRLASPVEIVAAYKHFPAVFRFKHAFGAENADLDSLRNRPMPLELSGSEGDAHIVGVLELNDEVVPAGALFGRPVSPPVPTAESGAWFMIQEATSSVWMFCSVMMSPEIARSKPQARSRFSGLWGSASRYLYCASNGLSAW